jgi:hypothetical protein
MITQLTKFMALAALALWTAVFVQKATATTTIEPVAPSGYVTTQSSYPGTGTPTSTSTGTQTQTASISNTTRNWAGYVAAGATYTAVHGTWTVPQVSGSGYVAADASWIGIGGTSSNDLIQTGTQNVVDPSGSVTTTAWYELLPDAESTVTDLNVSPGDSISASISQLQSGLWQISLKDNTTGGSYTTQVNYDSSLTSAEWVEEDPSDGTSEVPLDNFANVPFTGATTTANGQSESAAAAGAQTMTMVGDGGQQLADISTLTGGGQAFTVTRTAASSVTSTRDFGQGFGGWSRHGMMPGQGSGRLYRQYRNFF